MCWYSVIGLRCCLDYTNKCTEKKTNPYRPLAESSCFSEPIKRIITTQSSSPCILSWKGIINIENVKVNPYQSSNFTCYLSDNLQANRTTVQLSKYANGHRDDSMILRRSSALTNSHVFEVDNVAPGDQYLCMLEEGGNIANLTVTARTYGNMFD